MTEKNFYPQTINSSDLKDTLWVFEVGCSTEGLTKMYFLSPESCFHGAVTRARFALIAAVLCSQSEFEVDTFSMSLFSMGGK